MEDTDICIKSKKNTKAVHCILSAALAMIVFITLMAVGKVAPFGDKTYLVYDLKRQYLDFYAYLKSVIFSDNNLFYSFAGMGLDMTGIYAFNLTSPFLIIFILIPVEWYPAAFTLVYMLKIGCMAASMDVFLISVREKNNRTPGKGAGCYYMCDVLALAYALSTYVMSYGTNFMWLDALVMFPLVMLCLDRLIYTGKISGYVICTAVMMFLNYYIGYMAMIFAVLWTLSRIAFDGMADEDRRISGSRWKVLRRFILADVCAAGVDAFLLLPTFLSLQGTLRDNSVGVHKAGGSAVLTDIIARLLSGSFDGTQIYEGLPNITCGILIAILAVLFFALKGNGRADKLHMASLLAVMLISVSVDKLNLVWHAFSEPSGYLYRQSFIIVFMLVVCAAKGASALFTTKHQMAEKTIALAAAAVFMLLVWICLFCSDRIYLDAADLKRDLALTVVYLAGLAAVLFIGKDHIRRILVGAAALSLLADIWINDVSVYEIMSENCETASEFKEKYEHISASVEAVKASDTGFYRMENQTKRQQNDSMLFGYNGIELYVSSNKAATLNFLENLGYTDCEFYVDYGNGSTATADSILGIKYLLSDADASDIHPDYSAVSVPEQNAEKVYENPTVLPAAIATSSEPAEEYTWDDPFVLQAKLLEAMTGSGENVFEEAEVNSEQGTDQNSRIYHVTAAADGEMYMYIIKSDSDPEDIQIAVDDTDINSYGNASCYCTLNLGYMNKGDVKTVKTVCDTIDEQRADPVFATEREEVLKSSVSAAADCFADISKKSSSHLTMTVEKKSGVHGIFTTIPYSKDFRIRVNGTRVTGVENYGALLYIPLDGTAEGEVTVDLEYVPAGLGAGAVISAVTLLLFVFYNLRVRRKKNVSE